MLCRRRAPQGQENAMNMVVYTRADGIRAGIGFGTALAITISYAHNHSIFWAIIHGLLSWIYVIYAILFH
jgi:hypothetical protein